MSKTWYGHHIETIKGEDYVLHKDYTEIQDKLDKYKEVLDKIKKRVYHQQQSNENLEPYISTDKLDDILKLLEEIE